MNQLIVLPTGTGKTYVAAQIPRVIQYWKKEAKRGRILFLVHREELCLQTADTFREHTSLTVGIEKAGLYAGDADVVVGSVQTLGPAKVGTDDGEATFEYNPRLLALRPETFDCVIIDESHHAVKGKYYHNVMRHLRVLKGHEHRDPQTLLVCITATPNRADNVGMEVICDKISYEFGLRDAIKQGFLANLHPYRCETTTDISKIKTTAGDYSAGDLSNAVNNPARNELVAREYLRVRDMITPDFLSEQKPYAVLVDFVDNTGKNKLITASSLFGLREKFDPRGKDVLEQAEEMDKLAEDNPGLDLQGAIDLEDARRKADAYKTSLRKLDLLGPAIPNELRGLSKMTWIGEGEGAYRLGLMDNSMLTVRQNALGAYEVSRHVRGMRTLLAGANSLAAAVTRAESEISSSEKKILAADASWRSEPPTEKQAGRLIMIDKHFKELFKGSTKALFEYCMGRYELNDLSFSKGGLSDRMNVIDAARR